MLNAMHRRSFAAALLAGAGALGLSASSPAGADPTPVSAGDVAWKGTLLVQLRIADLDRSVKFYTETLGFGLHWRSDELKWAEVRPTGLTNVKVGLGVNEKPGSTGVSLNFGVADVGAARATLEAKGVTFLGPTVTVPDTVILADFADPDGNRIRLAQNLRPN